MKLMTSSAEDMSIEDMMKDNQVDELVDKISTEQVTIAVEKISVALFGKVSELFSGKVEKLRTKFINTKSFNSNKISKSLNKMVFAKYSVNVIHAPENFSGNLTEYADTMERILLSSHTEILSSLDDFISNISYIVTNNSTSMLRMYEGRSSEITKNMVESQLKINKFFPKDTGVTLRTLRDVFNSSMDIENFFSSVKVTGQLNSDKYVNQIIHKTERLGTAIDILRGSVANKETTALGKKELQRLANTIREQAEYVEWFTSLIFKQRELVSLADDLQRKLLKDFK